MWQLYIFFIVNSVFLFPLFSQESATNASLSPSYKSPVDTSQSTTGTADSLEKVNRLIQQKKFQDALEIALEILNKAQLEDDKELIFKSNDVIATIFKASNNFDKTLEYYKKNLALISSSNQDEINKAKLLNNIGTIFSQIQKLDSASVYFQKVIDLNSKSKTIEDLKAKSYTNLSGIQIINKQYEKAGQNALKALEIHKKYQDNNAIASTLNNLGSISLQQGNYIEAKKYFLEAIDLIRNEKSNKFLSSKEMLYDNLSYTLFKLKDYNSYVYQEKSFNIRDSIRDSEVLQILSEIEGKYNAENIKKQEQIKVTEEKAKRKHTQDINTILTIISLALLVGSWMVYRFLRLRQEKLQLELVQNQLIQQNELEKVQSESREKILNAAIDGKESERKMIAETLHHSVSSLLSSASLHLQASKMIMKGKAPEEIEKAHAIIKEASEKIRNLSHSLVSSVLLKFGLKYSVQDMCEKYSNSALTFNCECEDIKRYNPDFELKINSIIDELLNNIIKHSKATLAEILLKESNNILEIRINDNGNGFNPKMHQEKTGLGLPQIEARISKMKGIFTIDSAVSNGTKIYISVPIPEEVHEEVTV